MLRRALLFFLAASMESCGSVPNGGLQVGDFHVDSEECPITPDQIPDASRSLFTLPDGALWIPSFLSGGIPVGTLFEVYFAYPDVPSVLESPMTNRVETISSRDGSTTFRALSAGSAVIIAYEKHDHRLIDYTSVEIVDCSGDGGAPAKDASVDAP